MQFHEQWWLFPHNIGSLILSPLGRFNAQFHIEVEKYTCQDYVYLGISKASVDVSGFGSLRMVRI